MQLTPFLKALLLGFTSLILVFVLPGSALANQSVSVHAIEITSPSHNSSYLRLVGEEVHELVEAHGNFLRDHGIGVRQQKNPLRITLLANVTEYQSYKQASFSKSESPRGYYDHRDHRIVSWDPFQKSSRQISTDLRKVLIHETFHHQIHGVLGHDLPMWLDEGLAVLFENAVQVRGMRLDSEGIHRQALSQVKNAQQQGELIGLEEIITMNKSDFYAGNQAALHYSHAWSFVHFLMNDPSQKRRQSLAKVMKAMSNRQDPNQAIRAMAGHDLSRLERQWQQYIERL